jgi:hypothetical protein
MAGMSSSDEEVPWGLTVPLPSGTVRELIEALQKMPPDLLVTRYCDEVVTYAELRDYGRDEGSNGLGTVRHVALS